MLEPTPRRFFLFLFPLLLVWLSCRAVGAGDPAQFDLKKEKMVILGGVMVPMRDGINLATDIFLPRRPGPFPTVLLRTPYTSALGQLSQGINAAVLEWARDFTSQGYVFVLQDCRGTGRSEGDWKPFALEKDDGIELISWVQRQSWCNGKIATFGSSYCAYTQLVSAPHVQDSISTMLLEVPGYDWYWCNFIGGAYRLELMTGFDAAMVRPRASDVPLVDVRFTLKAMEMGLKSKIPWENLFRHLPLRSTGEVLGEKIPWMQDRMDNPEYGPFWHSTTSTRSMPAVRKPTLTCTGWYDSTLGNILHYYPEFRRKAESGPAKDRQYLIIGPWDHMLGRKTGVLSFGPEAGEETMKAIRQQWLARWLKGEKNHVDRWPFLQLFLMGDNCWRAEKEWPLARTQDTKYYFHGNKPANTSKGGGQLTEIPPAKEPKDSFTYDPGDPVPAAGGPWNFVNPCGPREQSGVECRKDVLVYTSEVLKKAVEVTGPVKVVLYAATDARDTDWTAKLVDVHPNDQAFNLCEGIIRARYRFPGVRSSFLEPNKVYRYEIDLWATSNVFKPGHRIRVQISSSNFPSYDRNPNTGHPFGVDGELRKANQAVYHDEEHPSHILLPVIPR